LNALPALFDPASAHGLTETYALKIGGDAFTARVADGHLDAQTGVAEDADLVAELDMNTFFSLANGELLPAEALERGLVKIEGPAEALERCFKAFHMAPRTPTAVA
jgi:putative sterol carrier protein